MLLKLVSLHDMINVCNIVQKCDIVVLWQFQSVQKLII